MNSWRESASTTAQGDIDELLNAVLPFAEQQLQRHGEFFPYAAGVTREGEQRLIGVDGLGERPASDDVLAALYRAATDYRAAAVVADVRVDGEDAIRVELEHSEGVSLIALLPYKRSRLRKSLTFGDMIAAPGNHPIW